MTSIPWDDHLLAWHGHLLQSWAWGELKSHFGWTPHRIQVGQARAQLLFRQLPLGRTIAYSPKGPLVDWEDEDQSQALLAAIHAEARRRKAVFLKIEPDVCPDHGQALLNFLSRNNFVPGDTIQPQSSIEIDLKRSEEAILAAMKQKTRYNIRLAQKKGVMVRQGGEVDVRRFYELADLTARRDGFAIHSLNYYQLAYQLFSPQDCALLMAELGDELLAAVMVFKFGPRAYYLYGASSNEHRNLMPAYLIQWAAIQWAKAQDCTLYDLWGIPDADLATLEAEFEVRQDGLWGVYRFKRGFGGQIVRSIGAYDYVYQPLLYRLYRWRRGG